MRFAEGECPTSTRRLLRRARTYRSTSPACTGTAPRRSYPPGSGMRPSPRPPVLAGTASPINRLTRWSASCVLAPGATRRPWTYWTSTRGVPGTAEAIWIATAGTSSGRGVLARESAAGGGGELEAAYPHASLQRVGGGARSRPGCGAPVSISPARRRVAEPYRLAATGDVAAAERVDGRRLPVRRGARAVRLRRRARCGALARFSNPSPDAAAQATRRRCAGADFVPCRPGAASTRSHPSGLTRREGEVLG